MQTQLNGLPPSRYQQCTVLMVKDPNMYMADVVSHLNFTAIEDLVWEKHYT